MEPSPPIDASLKDWRRQCALKILELYHRAHAGHIGSSLSCLEILVELCFGRMTSEDQLILSKGHAAAALYTVLSLSGRMPGVGLETFYAEGTLLAAHPPCGSALRAIPFGTGSLGHGLGLAAGLALSQQFTGRCFQTYAILSDGDCDEGSTWEAALFAAHHQLRSLTVIVDRNGVQGFGRTGAVLDLEPLAEKWRAFGFEVVEAERGNDLECLGRAHAQLERRQKPGCILAKTTKGHGVSYMEDRLEWHYLPMSQEQYDQAVLETLAR